jgi:hypothetical protein
MKYSPEVEIRMISATPDRVPQSRPLRHAEVQSECTAAAVVDQARAARRTKPKTLRAFPPPAPSSSEKNGSPPPKVTGSSLRWTRSIAPWARNQSWTRVPPRISPARSGRTWSTNPGRSARRTGGIDPELRGAAPLPCPGGTGEHDPAPVRTVGGLVRASAHDPPIGRFDIREEERLLLGRGPEMRRIARGWRAM